MHTNLTASVPGKEALDLLRHARVCASLENLNSRAYSKSILRDNKSKRINLRALNKRLAFLNVLLEFRQAGLHQLLFFSGKRPERVNFLDTIDLRSIEHE